MDSKDPIIIKLATSFPPLFHNIEKFCDHINNALAHQTGNGLYIEPVVNGLIYFYKDLPTLRLLNRPYHPYIDAMTSSETPLSRPIYGVSFFLAGVIDQISFPIEGISLSFENLSNNSDDVVQVFEDFFTPLQDQEICIRQFGATKLEVFFKTFAALKAYADAVESLFYNHL
jgi:hypothetical protein